MKCLFNNSKMWFLNCDFKESFTIFKGNLSIWHREHNIRVRIYLNVWQPCKWKICLMIPNCDFSTVILCEAWSQCFKENATYTHKCVFDTESIISALEFVWICSKYVNETFVDSILWFLDCDFMRRCYVTYVNVLRTTQHEDVYLTQRA